MVNIYKVINILLLHGIYLFYFFSCFFFFFFFFALSFVLWGFLLLLMLFSHGCVGCVRIF